MSYEDDHYSSYGRSVLFPRQGSFDRDYGFPGNSNHGYGEDRYIETPRSAPTPPPPPPILEFTRSESALIDLIVHNPLDAFDSMQRRLDPYSQGSSAGKIGKETEVGVWVYDSEIDLRVKTSSAGLRKLRESLGAKSKVQSGLKIGTGIFDFVVAIGKNAIQLGIQADWEGHTDETMHVIPAGRAYPTPEFLAQLVEVIEPGERRYVYPGEAARVVSLSDASYKIRTPLRFAEEEVLKNQAKVTQYLNTPVIGSPAEQYVPETPRVRGPDLRLENRQRARQEINDRLNRHRRKR